MTLGTLGMRNVLRNPGRTLLTMLGVAVAIVAFTALRTVLSSWMDGVNYAAKDRIATRHKVTFVMTLPKRYVEEIRNTPGVVNATYSNWFGGQNPRRENEFFATVAVDPKSFLEVYDEVQVTPAEREAWLANRRGAVVGDVIAKKFGWKVGDKVTLKGTIYPGNWDFEISGIYTATRRSVDRSSFWFHWDYLNESLRGRNKDQIGWVGARIDKPERAAEIAKRIDAHFEERDIQTLSMSERALNTSFMGMFTTVLKAMDIVSIVILVIMVLILGNTIAMGVRERTNEYGVLRAIGFMPKHIALFVVGEAITTGLLGGLLGVAISYPLVEHGIGRWLEENMGGLFPYFRIAESTTVAAVVLSLVLGGLAAGIPAYRAARLDVIDALRRVG